jgi:hypothetical protein
MPSFDDSFPGTRLPSPATNLLYVGFMDRSVKKTLCPDPSPINHPKIYRALPHPRRRATLKT